MAELTASDLMALVRYDGETGLFYRLVRRDDRKQGRPAGWQMANGYVGMSVKNRQFYAHRLAFLYMTGAWPVGIVDHINGDKTDNRWGNLRDANKSINSQNVVEARSDSSTGLLGASPHRNGFIARIRTAQGYLSLGSYPTAEQAHEAYMSAKKRIHAGYREYA